MPKSIAVEIPTRRTHKANSFGTLMSKSATAQSATPLPNEGMPPSRPAATPETRKLSPIANTRKPAATQSQPFRKNFMVKNALATTKLMPSINQNTCRIGVCETTVPAMPNTAPNPSPMAAIQSRLLSVGFMSCFSLFVHQRPFTRASRTKIVPGTQGTRKVQKGVEGFCSHNAFLATSPRTGQK